MRNILFYSLMLFSLKAWAVDPFACKANSDCVRVYVGCGHYGAAHRDHGPSISEKARNNDADSFCVMPSKEEIEAEKRAQPQCKDNKCQLVPTP